MMIEASDNAMDVDVEGAQGNIDMEPSQTQANKNSSKKLQLADLPKEMLEEILIYLDDENLLNASHVCKLFAPVAESAFARKYSKEWYNICNKNRESFHKVVLNKYGGKMRKIGIQHCEDEEMLKLVEQKCVNVKSLGLCDVSRIVLLKDLKQASLLNSSNEGQEAMTEFININPKLETLRMALVDANSLAIERFSNLKTLQIDVGDATDCIRHLKALTCNQIEKLVLLKCNASNADDDDLVNEICKFRTLVSLYSPLDCITSDGVKKLAAHLPYLTELSVPMMKAVGDSEVAEKILSTTSTLPKLTKFSIRLSKDNFDRFSNKLKSSANGFHARFAKSNTEIKLMNHPNMISITTDYLFLYQERSVELHWMDNLNEENVRKLLSSNRSAKELKFVNHCANRTFDIAALAYADTKPHIEIEHSKCLDIKSNGPISVKSNVSRYQEWFPHLKILRIHLERHSANDFLQNLQTNFCEQIEELWLNTKGDSEDPTMPNVLAKFGNMKSLHLGPSSIKYDTNHLFSVCRNLTEIKLTRVLSLNEKQ